MKSNCKMKVFITMEKLQFGNCQWVFNLHIYRNKLAIDQIIICNGKYNYYNFIFQNYKLYGLRFIELNQFIIVQLIWYLIRIIRLDSIRISSIYE